MQCRTQKDLMKQLAKEGITFSQFCFIHEGNYRVSDADWNYKDVPHLNILHKLVNAYPGYIGDDVITTINAQKVFGIKMPLAVANFQSGPGRQTYYTTWLMFVLIVETTYEEISENKTRVLTNYAVGSSPLFQIFVPVIKYLLKKNYDNLMNDDIAMRSRRGQLREWGYRFAGDQSDYSFEETMAIHETNVIHPDPEMVPHVETITIPMSVFEKQSEYYVGRSDHLGLRLVKTDNQIAIYPRLCPHEGGCLDESRVENNKVHCPWHGRVFRPLGSIDITNTEAEQCFETEHYRIGFQNASIFIESKAAKPLVSSI